MVQNQPYITKTLVNKCANSQIDYPLSWDVYGRRWILFNRRGILFNRCGIFDINPVQKQVGHNDDDYQLAHVTELYKPCILAT